MARFDVYAVKGLEGYVIDVQANLLDVLNTRVTIPLLPLDTAPPPAKRLNPVFEINGVAHVCVTQYMAAMPRSALQDCVADLRDQSAAITDAVDFVMQGF